MAELIDIKETFQALVNDIKQSKCLYEGENEESAESEKRMADFSSMKLTEETHVSESISEQMTAFILTTNRLFSIVSEQRNIQLDHGDFFKYYTKALAKKDGKAQDGKKFTESFWFLANDLEDSSRSINFGKIVRCQLGTKGRLATGKKFKNYLHMLYFQAVQLQYPDILTNRTEESYISADTLKYYNLIRKQIEDSLNDSENELSSDCEINESLTTGIKDMCNSMVDELIPDAGMKDVFKNMMGNDHMSNVLSNLLSVTCKPSDIKKLKRELKDTDADDLRQVCEDTKKTLSSMDMDLSKFGDEDKFKEMQASMEDKVKAMGGDKITEQMKNMMNMVDGPMPDMDNMMKAMGQMMKSFDAPTADASAPQVAKSVAAVKGEDNILDSVLNESAKQ